MTDDSPTPIELPALFVAPEPTLADVVRQECAALLLIAAACEGTKNLNGSAVAGSIRAHVRLLKQARERELAATVDLTPTRDGAA